MEFGVNPNRHLDAFLDRLTPRARILELGCGGGSDAAHMANRGFDIDATDGCEAMVQQANGRFALAARAMRFDQLSALAEYDAVWANACLLHVARADMPSVLLSIHRALRPGGWHYACYKLGTGEGRDLLGRLHNFPTVEWIADRYAEAGFTLVDREIYPGKAADGTKRQWIALTVRKP